MLKMELPEKRKWGRLKRMYTLYMDAVREPGYGSG